MATAVDMCNTALSFLGQEATMTSIDPPEGSPQADECARYYPISRDYLLEKFPWSFATRRAALALLSEDVNGWRYCYTRPSDAARIICVTDEADRYALHPRDYIVEISQANPTQQIILTDVEDAYIRYTFLQDNTSLYTESFCQALSYLLAYRLAGSLLKGTAGIKIAEEMYKLFMAAFSQATQLDAQQSTDNMRPVASWRNNKYVRVRQ